MEPVLQNNPVQDPDGRNQRMKYPMRSLDFYGKETGILGKGTYGTVLRLESKYPSQIVAVKIFKTDPDGDGVRRDTLREIAILRRLKHPNLVKLIDIINFNASDLKSEIKAVLELASFSLWTVLTDNKLKASLDTALVKSYMYQLTRGLVYLHDNAIVHRDLKPQNILVFADTGRIVIADFGISRAGFILGGSYTAGLETLWWRAPELLFGAQEYGPAVDVYSMGLIFAEMWRGDAIFRGLDTEDRMLLGQIEVLGHMTEEFWPGISGYEKYTHSLSEYAKTRAGGKWDRELYSVLEQRLQTGAIRTELFLTNRKIPLSRKDCILTEMGLNLIKQATYPNPSYRSTARDLLANPYFSIIDPGQLNINIKNTVEQIIPTPNLESFTCGSNLDTSQLTGVEPIVVRNNITSNISKVSNMVGNLNISGSHIGGEIEVEYSHYRKLFNWIADVVDDYKLANQTFYHSRLLIDYYIQQRVRSSNIGETDSLPVTRNNLQLIGLGCLLISAKLFDRVSLPVDDLAYIADDQFTASDILSAELAILKILNFDLYFPTIGEYVAYALGNNRDENIIKTIHIIAKMTCCIVYPINTRLIAYSSVYIVLRCWLDQTMNLPDCFFASDEETYSINDIAMNADLMIKQLKASKGSYIKSTKMKKEVQIIFNSWNKCRVKQQDVLSPAFNNLSVFGHNASQKAYSVTMDEEVNILDEFTYGELDSGQDSSLPSAAAKRTEKTSTVERISPKEDIDYTMSLYLTAETRKLVNADGSSLSRDSIAMFAKRLIINRALIFVKWALQQYSENLIYPFVRYFKFSREINGGYRIGDVDPERIQIKMGDPNAATINLRVKFESIPSESKHYFDMFCKRFIVTKEQYTFHDMEGKFTDIFQ